LIDLGLDGKRALVTGAGAGMGQATAVLLASAGCDVAVVDIDPAGLEETVPLVEKEGRRAVPLVTDVRDEAAVDAMVAATVDVLGGLDVAVNNVGMMAGRTPAPFVQLDGAYIRDIVEQNFVATALCCRAEAAFMVQQGTGGAIVNVSSGESKRPALTLAPYGAAKAAINHLTQTLAVELGPHGIRVNAAAPGTTLTKVVRAAFTDEHVAMLEASSPLGRICDVDDLARSIVFLASDLARNVTGQLVLADYGAHLSRTRPPPPGTTA